MEWNSATISQRNSTVEVGFVGEFKHGALATLHMAQPPGTGQSRPSSGQQGQAGANGKFDCAASSKCGSLLTEGSTGSSQCGQTPENSCFSALVPWCGCEARGDAKARLAWVLVNKYAARLMQATNRFRQPHITDNPFNRHFQYILIGKGLQGRIGIRGRVSVIHGGQLECFSA